MEGIEREERKVVKMDINTWIKEVKEGEKELAGVSEKQVRIIVHHLFAKLNGELNAINETASFRMAGLGRFRISFGRKKNGEENAKHMLYVPEEQVGRWTQGGKGGKGGKGGEGSEGGNEE